MRGRNESLRTFSFERKLKIPSKLENRFDGRGNSVGGPHLIVELGDCSRFVVLRVFDQKVADRKVLAPNVNRHQMNLELESDFIFLRV